MCLSLHNHTRFVNNFQWVITPMFNHHTRAVATSLHHHHFCFIDLIVIESLDGTSIDADYHLRCIPMSMNGRLRSGQENIQHPLPIFLLAIAQIIIHTQPRRFRSQFRHKVKKLFIKFHEVQYMSKISPSTSPRNH